eukprot:2345834-Pyramimonas_sp.AAC.1
MVMNPAASVRREGCGSCTQSFCGRQIEQCRGAKCSAFRPRSNCRIWAIPGATPWGSANSETKRAPSLSCNFAPRAHHLAVTFAPSSVVGPAGNH